MAKKKMNLRDYAHKLNVYNDAVARLTEEMAGMKETLDAYKERQGIIKERMILLMHKTDKTTVISGLHQYHLSKTPAAIIIADEKKVPKTYLKSITKESVDKAQMKIDIKEGKLKTSKPWFDYVTGEIIKHKALEEEKAE